MRKPSIKVKFYLICRGIWRKLYRNFKEKLGLPNIRIPERMSERIVEYPFVLKNLSKLKSGKILDVGCCGSYLLTELASLGYEVYGIDIRWYPVKYPNVKFIRGNICKTEFPDDFFDAVIAVSTVEHIGIKQAYEDIDDPEGDKKAIKEMTRILKPDGKMLITVPYGKSIKDIWFRSNERIYNDIALRELLYGLNVETIEYYALKNSYWLPVSKSEADQMEISHNRPNAVTLVKASKPE